MVGLDEQLVDGEGYVVIQPRWKERPETIELEFVEIQRRIEDFSADRHPSLLTLNIKATPNQMKMLKQFQPSEVSVIGADGIAESIVFEKWDLWRYSPGPRGHWGYGIWTRALPSPGTIVRLRLSPKENGGDLQ